MDNSLIALWGGVALVVLGIVSGFDPIYWLQGHRSVISFVTIVIGIGAAIWGVGYLGRKIDEKERKEKAEIKAWIESLEDRFPQGRLFYFVKDKSYCVIDSPTRTISILDQTRGAGERKYSFDQLFEVEVLRDGQTVISTDRVAAAGGAIVGALLFGVVGGVVGGLSGQKTQISKISKISVRLRLDDMNYPLQEVFFLKEDEPLPIDSEEVEQAAQKAETFAAAIQNILTKNKVST